MMNNIIILLIIIIVLSYFVFLYDLNNFIIDKFIVDDNKCYSKNMDNIDVNMRSCKLYYTDNISLCDKYPELYHLTKNRLLYNLNNSNNKENITIYGNNYTKEVIEDVINDKSKNNINFTCSFDANRLYEIDNKLGDSNKYQKKIITNNISNNSNYLYSCFFPLESNHIDNNGLINQSLINEIHLNQAYTPCLNDRKPITNIICHGNNCPNTSNFLALDLNINENITNIINIDDQLIFIKFKKTNNYGIKNINFDSFVMYNRNKKVFENVDNQYIKNIIDNKLFTFIYKNGKIYLTPRIINTNVFTFIFNDKNNIMVYDIFPFNNFSFKYLNINDIQLDNYNTYMSSFLNDVKNLEAYIKSKTNEILLNNDKIDNYINEYNNLKIRKKEEAIERLNNEIYKINEIINILNINKSYYLKIFPNYKEDIEIYYYNIIHKYNNMLLSKKNILNNIQNAPINNINKLELYPDIFNIVNLSQISFNNAYINNFDDSLLSDNDNCIYVNISI